MYVSVSVYVCVRDCVSASSIYCDVHFSFRELNRLLQLESAAKAAEKGKWSKSNDKVCICFLHTFVMFMR